MNTLMTLLGTMMTLSLSAVWAADSPRVTRGTVYELGSQRGKVLYRLQRTQTALPEASETKVLTVFNDLDNKEIAREELVVGQSQVRSYRIEHKLVQEQGTVEVRDGKVYFAYTRGGVTQKDDVDWTSNFAVGPWIVLYAQKHWAPLLAGNELSIRMGVPDRLDTYGFRFIKTGVVERAGRKLVEVQLKATSIFVAAKVDPVLFYFDLQDGSLESIVGRTLLKQGVAGKAKDLDAEVVFDWTHQ